MSNHVRRQAPPAQQAPPAAAPHRDRASAAPPNNKPWPRRLLGAFAAVALAVGAGFAAPAPAAAADTQQSYIVVLQDGVVDPAAAAAAQQGSYGFTVSTVYRDAVNGYAATMTASTAALLATDPRVDFITAARTFAQPTDPAAGPQVPQHWWQRVGGTAPGGVNKGVRSPVDVNVAVIDSGIDSTHPDLNVRGGVDCSTGSPVKVTPTDLEGHGTFVAGVIGAKDNDFGVVGAAPGTPLWSVRVADDNGMITEAMLICAIDWVTATRRDKDKTNDIQVANISIGGLGADTANCGKGKDPMHYAICRSVKAGVVYAVAAGNSSADLANFVPATYDEVLTATAMADFDGKAGGLASPLCGTADWSRRGLDDQPALFSNFATQSKDRAHTVAGPGVCVTSTSPLPAAYAVMDGTSFASPAVAGSVALCISSKQCKGAGKDVMARFLALTKSYNENNRDFGFAGDPFHPISGHYYGYLTQIAKY